MDTTLWRLPERRLTLDAGASSQAGRLWSEPSHSFEKLQGSLRLHWLPQSQGDDYEMQQRFRAGKTFGDVPFDELFILGLERDNDLEMRGHIGTRDGRKGSAPLGRNYFLSNWEADKNVYSNGIFTVKLGPFLDTGKITDASDGTGLAEMALGPGRTGEVASFRSRSGFLVRQRPAVGEQCVLCFDALEVWPPRTFTTGVILNGLQAVKDPARSCTTPAESYPLRARCFASSA